MRIVIDGRSAVKKNFGAEHRKYISDVFGLLVREKPQAGFCFLVDEKLMEEELSGSGAAIIYVNNQFRGLPLASLWQRKQLSKTLSDQKADLLLSLSRPAGYDFGIPESVWLIGKMPLPDRVPADYSRVRSWLFTGSETMKSDLIRKQIASPDKVLSVPLCAEEGRLALTWTQKENIKVRWAGGKEYFLSRSSFSGEHLMLLLKAFSRFKKKQQSNMQLLITGRKGDPQHAQIEKLETYKYRDDVHVYANLDEATYYDTTAAAYALLHPGEPELGTGLLNAMQAWIPVVCNDSEKVREIAGECIMGAGPGDVESFSDGMIRIYKDEPLRNELIRKGKLRAQQFTRQQSAAAVWNGLMRAYGDQRSVG